MIRITKLSLENFKNVESGSISLSSNNSDAPIESADIIGIYGQNGSGKTAVVQALYLLKRLMMGGSLDKSPKELITCGKDSALLYVEGFIFDDGDSPKFRFGYEAGLAPSDRDVSLVSERLSYSDLSNEKGSARTLFEFDSEETDGRLLPKPKTHWDAIAAIVDSLKVDLLVAQKIAKDRNASLLFCEEMTSALTTLRDEITEEKFEKLSKRGKSAVSEVLVPLVDVRNSLSEFAWKSLAVILANHQFESSVNFLRLSTHEGEYGPYVDFGMDLDIGKPAKLSANQFEQLDRTLKTIGPVMTALVPGLVLSAKCLGNIMLDDGGDGCLTEIVSTRGDSSVPLRCESEGIKKLVSILSLLVDVYSNPGSCVVIDELDSGVFEFLLGEILEVLQDGGVGQLIFTAHNLRPLEVMKKGSIVFTTTNPRERYITFRGSYSRNNLRDQYLRAINLGGQPETIYEPTSRFNIEAAFYDAGCSDE